MKKIKKTIASILVSCTVLGSMAITAYAAICPPHRYGENQETLVNQYSAGSHTHMIGTDASGNQIPVTCFMSVKVYRGYKQCQKCGQVADEYTYNITEHSALQ